MASERELKLAVADCGRLLAALEAAGARLLHGESFEDNTLWDQGDTLRAGSCLLRVRHDGQGTRLTYKGPPSFEQGVKVRQELETQVADGDSLAAILRALGYAPVRRYQKYRQEWTLDEVTIAVDRTPMGDFAEFEGDAALAVAERCGCPPETALAADYLTLYDAYRESHPEAPADMLFAAPEAADG